MLLEKKPEPRNNETRVKNLRKEIRSCFFGCLYFFCGAPRRIRVPNAPGAKLF